MSRNAIKTNQLMFAKLNAALPPAAHLPTGLLIGPNRKRWVGLRGTHSSWYRLLMECKLTVVVPQPAKYVVSIIHGRRAFIALPEPPSERGSPPFMRGLLGPKNFHPGILAAVWGATDFPVRNPKDWPDIGWQLVDKVFGREGKYKSSELRPFFADLDVWEVDTNCHDMSEGSLLAIYGGRLTTQPDSLSLDFTEDTRSKIRLLFEQYPGPIVADAVFRGLTATHWVHAFLEFYRCIERLYNVPFVEELCSKLDYTAKAQTKVAEDLEDVLGWRPQESTTLVRLLNDLEGTPVMAELRGALPIPTSANGDNTSHQAVAKAIYMLRNRIAHWRPGLETRDRPKDWDAVIGSMCGLIVALYTHWKHCIAS